MFFQPERNISNPMSTLQSVKFLHNGPDSLRLGIVVATGVYADIPVPSMEEVLSVRLASLADGLNPEQDAYRAHIRDIFRNRSYKPTGRAKPASEYLFRVAAEGTFPRINTLVDICNTLSVSSLLPISVWDLDRAGGDAFEFRLGAVDESYVFNASGQEINLNDLIVGCLIREAGASQPIVNAVKDSHATKTHDQTSRVAAAIYAPLDDGPDLSLMDTCRLFEEWLGATAEGCSTRSGILMPGESLTLG